MCGIAGIFVNDPADLDRGNLSALAAGLAHRGPDGEGIWVSSDGKAGLVHRRLAIIDTSDGGHQPMHSANGNYTIVYNGEVFNFLELRSELEGLGSRFQSDSDTEVLLEAWRHWGEAMLERFNGMWALVIRDNLSGDVFFARDRFGVKPLLYAHSSKRLIFASEMRVLRSLACVDGALNKNVAKRTLFDPFSIEGSASTLVSAISRLPGGHLARLHNGQLTVERWWRTTDHLIDIPSNQVGQAKRFKELFFDAVKLRLRSDVSVGTCLSGGFDSSAIACAMSQIAAASELHLREATDWRHAFIASFPGQSNDETAEAMEAVAYAGVTPHVLRFDNQDPLAQIDQILGDLDDVYISLPTAPWQIYRELRESGTLVSLDGHGADEMMGGYRQAGQAFGFALRNQVARLSQNSSVVRHFIDSAKLTWLTLRGINFLRGHTFAAPTAPVIASDADKLPRHWGALNRRLYRMFHASVLPTILRNFDRLSMAHGVEVRMPFMDWRLVVYVMSLPDNSKSADGRTKAVARNAMAGCMPESIRTAKRKVGFNSPMPEWLNGSLGEWVQDLLAKRNDEFDELVDTVRLRKLVRSLSRSGGWNWELVGRVWPYIHLKWYLHQSDTQ